LAPLVINQGCAVTWSLIIKGDMRMNSEKDECGRMFYTVVGFDSKRDNLGIVLRPTVVTVTAKTMEGAIAEAKKCACIDNVIAVLEGD
jgi:hypothetical protein